MIPNRNCCNADVEFQPPFSSRSNHNSAVHFHSRNDANCHNVETEFQPHFSPGSNHDGNTCFHPSANGTHHNLNTEFQAPCSSAGDQCVAACHIFIQTSMGTATMPVPNFSLRSLQEIGALQPSLSLSVDQCPTAFNLRLLSKHTHPCLPFLIQSNKQTMGISM